jgi:hypothetical protein
VPPRAALTVRLLFAATQRNYGGSGDDAREHLAPAAMPSVACVSSLPTPSAPTAAHSRASPPSIPPARGGDPPDLHPWPSPAPALPPMRGSRRACGHLDRPDASTRRRQKLWACYRPSRAAAVTFSHAGGRANACWSFRYI